LGGHAFGTSRTPDKIERAKPYGLEDGFIVPEPDALKGLADFAKRVTARGDSSGSGGGSVGGGGRGFDVVLDLNGGPYFAASLEAMALRGRIILIGGVAGGRAEVDLYQILGKRLHVIGTVLRARSLEEKIAITKAFAQEVVPLLAGGSVKPVIDSVFPLEEIQHAHRRLESNETFGKVVLTI
jgi:NADPH:quinone reductase-like Zn-dependent oxidoreductase